VQEYIKGQAMESFVILRHDVDRRPEMAQMEKDMGHEVGYHYEVLDNLLSVKFFHE
jgi:hypothetical protein